MSKYKIDKNIPIPKSNYHYSSFPFSELEIGDSFLVTMKDLKKTSCIQLRQFLYNKARQYCVETFSLFKFCFCVDRKNKSVRVFRIE